MTKRILNQNIQDDVMTVANLYKGNIHSVSGRTVIFSFDAADDRVGFQTHLQEIKIGGIKLIKDEHGMKLRVEFLQ